MRPFWPLWLLLAAAPAAPLAPQAIPPATDGSPRKLGLAALSLGRNPGDSPSEIAAVRTQLLDLSHRVGRDADAAVNVTRGIEAMARATWRRVPLDGATLGRLAELVRERSADPRVRRHALGALLVAQVADSVSVAVALTASDEQLRRLAVIGLPRLSATARAVALPAAMNDPAAMVRIEALRVWARSEGAGGCGRLARSAGEKNLTVALVAIDLLAQCSGDSAASRVLLAALSRPGGERWHSRAHALVSLARAFPGRAGEFLPSMAVSPTWQVRMYAARAAAVGSAVEMLRRLSRDPVANVGEAAITGLVHLMGHAADTTYREALAAGDYQLVLTAAAALAGTPDRMEAVRAITAALRRISVERSETSRDPRVALLVRIREVGTPADSATLLPLIEDFDPVVADSAAAILSAWTGTTRRAVPRPLPADTIPGGEVESLRGGRLRFIMASGGRFEVSLLVDEAPGTVARIVRLVRLKYYDGLTFHRVVPNFVLQGGSPGANEYAGYARFMPDELGETSHARGTLGVSTRGRHTGDAQFFINLVDNPRLDFDYTVWGRLISGLKTVDAVQEGDIIRRVEFRPR